MKLLLFILGLTLITASPTLRRLQFETDSFSENTEGIFVSANWEEDENVITDDFSWIFENDEPSNEEGNLENVALEEENIFPSEEEVLPQEPEDLLTQVRNDPVTSGILDFGVETLIAAGIVKEKIPNVPFTVTSISGLTKTTSNEGDLYDFSCQAVSENGNSVIEMNFTVYYDFHTERRILSSYSYVITTTTTTPTQPSQPENEYVQVSDADIESDAVVHSVLEYGVAQILAIGTQAGKIPVSEFAIQDVVSVWKQVTDTGANYKCEVVLENANKATINADFTIAYTSATQQSTLTAYNYTVNIVNVPVPPVDNNNGTTVDGYDVLTGDQISSSAEVQAVLAYGVQQILNSGYASGKIPQSDYDITKIIGVARKTQIKRITYQCEVELQDVKEVLVQARFVIYVNTSTEGLSIGSWSYNVSNIRTPNTPVDDTFTYLNETEIADSAEAQSVLAFGVDAILKSGYAKGKIPVSQYNITEIDHVALKHENKRTVYSCKIELQDAKKVKIDAEFTVYVKANQALDMGSWAYNVTNIRNPTNPTTPTNNTNTTTPTNPTNPTNNTNTTTPTNPTNNTNTTTPTQPTTPVDNSTNTTVDGFVALSNEEIYSADVLAVLDYGSDQVLASGNAKGKIPVSDYKITRIDSVLKKVEAKRTTYRCDVVMTGTNKAKVDTVFDVYVRNGNYSMGGWSYNVSNIIKPTNPTNTTNTTTPTTPTNNTNTNTTTPTTPTQPTNNTNTTTPTQPANNTNTTTPTQPTTPVDNSTNTTVDGFVALNNEEIYSADVLDVLDYGTDQVLASGNAKGKIPVSNYKITRIDSVLKKVEAKRTTYRCDVVMTGTNKVKVDAVLDVYVRNGNYSMGGWSYNVSNIPVTQTNNTNTNTTKPTPVNTNNNTNTGNNNTATPTAPTTPVTNNTTNTTAPVVPTTPTTPVVSNNVSASNFTALTEAQIQAADVQAILAYGGDQVIQKGTASGKIPASTYSINKVNSVAVKTETTRTVYKCNVELLGANKLYVRTEYNVYVKNGTQEKSLGPYSYATAWV